MRSSRTRFPARGRHRGTKIKFRLSRPGLVELVVRGPSPSCDVVGRMRVHGHPGTNSVRFSGRLHGRPLAPGKYTIAVVVVRGGSRKGIGKIAVEVVPPGQRLTKRERSAPVAAPCGRSAGGAGGAGGASGVGGGFAAFVSGARIVEQTRHSHRSSAQNPPPPSQDDSSTSHPLRPPHLTPPSGFGGHDLSWVFVVLTALLALAIGVYLVRLRRGSWEP